jgi:hypothetical protein
MKVTPTKTPVGLLLMLAVFLVPFVLVSARPTPAATGASSAVRATKTKIACKPGAVTPKASTTCTITVSDASTGKKVAPVGDVSLTTNGPGSFQAPTCTLTPAVSASSCAVRYTAAQIGTGVHMLKASYPGDETHGASVGAYELNVTPPNDQVRAAELLRQPPSFVTGTTVGSTSSYSDPEVECASVGGNVWYRLVPQSSQKLAVRLNAHGKLDAVLGIFRQVRSQTRPVACVSTDDKGFAGLAFDAQKRGRYLIVVGEREESASSTFRLDLSVPPRAHPPGKVLARAGVRSRVDPLTRPEEAWSVVFAAGTTYRLNLAAARERCISLSLFQPKTKSFSGTSPIRRAACGGYLVFTPGPDGGGRYSLLVEAEGSRAGMQPYRLDAAPAGADDTAPGVLLQNGERRRGALAGSHIDVVDLYRFDVEHRSDVTIGFDHSRGLAFEVQLLGADGQRLGRAGSETGGGKLRRQLDEGQYYFALRALHQSAGRYRVGLLVREITTTSVMYNGSPDAVSTLGDSVALQVTVTPQAAAGGVVRLQLDRFDPIEGWQFVRTFTVRVGSGGATVSWRPTAVGRWRIHAVYMGTRAASPSSSGYAYLAVKSHSG